MIFSYKDAVTVSYHYHLSAVSRIASFRAHKPKWVFNEVIQQGDSITQAVSQPCPAHI